MGTLDGKLTSIHRNALVMHSAASMYALVNDVTSYPKFLPWCSKAELIQQNEQMMIAKIEIEKAGLRQAFTTKNLLTEGEAIVMQLVEGPFQNFTGSWQFMELGNSACKVQLDLEFVFTSRLASTVIGKVFDEAANQLVDAFCQRAKELNV